MRSFLLIICAVLALPPAQAGFWESPEFREADNVANLPLESIKERRQEKYKIIDWQLYQEILRAYDKATLEEGGNLNFEFASYTRSPMYTSTSNESRSILAPRPVELYMKFSDDYSRICIRRDYIGLMGLLKTSLETRCLTLRPDSGPE